MTYCKWRITIENWVYSGIDQKLAGSKKNDYDIEADGIDMAVSFAHAIVKGIRTNPAIWEAPIISIVQVGE
jgi:hypothetical protein